MKRKYSRFIINALFATTAGTLLAVGAPEIVGNHQIQQVHADNMKPNDIPAEAFDEATWQNAVVKEVNRLRAQNGLKPVTANQDFMNEAVRRAKQMQADGYISHNGMKNMLDNKTVMEVCNEGSQFTGGSNTDSKNIIFQFYNYGGVPTFGHSKELLNPYSDTIGVGIVKLVDNSFIVNITFGQPNANTNIDEDYYNKAWKYFDYISKTGIDTVNYPTIYDIKNQYHTFYDAGLAGQNLDGVIDSKYDANTKTVRNPTGTETGFPDNPPVGSPAYNIMHNTTGNNSDNDNSHTNSGDADLNLDTLNNTLAKANTYLSGNYTQDSINALQNIINTITSAHITTQTQADDFTNQLNTAINNLVPATNNSGNSGSGTDNSGSGSDNGGGNSNSGGSSSDNTGSNITNQVQESALTIAQAYINYVPGYGVNEYSYPNASWDGVSRIQHGTTVSVIKQATYNGETWYQLSNGNWVKAQYVKEGVNSAQNIEGVAEIVYDPGYGIAVYTDAGSGVVVVENGQQKHLLTGTYWKIFKIEQVNGINYYNVGGNQWIDARYANAVYKKV